MSKFTSKFTNMPKFTSMSKFNANMTPFQSRVDSSQAISNLAGSPPFAVQEV